MRRGGKAAAGGYSEKIFTGIPLYCRLYWNDVKQITGTTKKKMMMMRMRCRSSGLKMRCGE